MDYARVLPTDIFRRREKRLAFTASSIDAALSSAQLERFERELETAVLDVLRAAADSPIGEQVRWHFGIGLGQHRGGKRLRPRLLLHVALQEGATFDEALDAALAVECLHNYSLVHDDIEDGDAMRHGREAVWARFGMSHGVNAGDSLCAVSYLTLLRNRRRLPAERIAAMTRTLHEANFAMCAGQGYDIGFETAQHVTMASYMAMIDGKTAVLFGAACELGALCAGIGERRARAYGEFGRAYGRAFQIYDDILGTWGSYEQTGKPARADILHRKWAFPIVWALAGPPSEARRGIAGRYALPAPLAQSDVNAVIDALDALDARRAAECAFAAELEHANALAERHGLDPLGAARALFAQCGASGSGNGMSAGSRSRGRPRNSTIDQTSARTTAVSIPSSTG